MQSGSNTENAPTHSLDLCGLKCPQPAMKVATLLVKLAPGETLEATADCNTFEDDIRGLCKRWKKVLLSVRQRGEKKTVLIRS